jgi:hypothetical protein
MNTRTTRINTMARTTRILTDSRSVPNIIGIGPISKIPAARCPLFFPDPDFAIMIIEITASMKPIRISPIAIPVILILGIVESDLLAEFGNINSSDNRRIDQPVIVYKLDRG